MISFAENLKKNKVTILAAVAAFSTYLCFYPFRRAYTAATFTDLAYFGISFKILIITAQVIGFAVSKAIGVKVVSEMQPEKRATNLLIITAISWLCMLFFGLVPPPYNLIFVFLGSLPLGLFYGIILGFLEGRRVTDLLVASLTASFIVGSGFAKSIGKWLLDDFGISEFMMPFVADTIMYIPLAISVYFLAKIPPPNSQDITQRVARKPMDKASRKAFVSEFRLGLILFIISYVLLTAYREFRDNFTPEIMKELGFGSQIGIFTKTEVPIAVVVLLIMVSIRWVKTSEKAFNIIQGILLLGAVIVGLSTLLYQTGVLSPIAWLIGVGFGAYIAYAMCNSLYFEHMIATFKHAGTVGFLITLADYYAYFGSLTVLFYKNYFQSSISNVTFFINASYTLSIVYFCLVILSIFYFRGKKSSVV